MSAGAEAAGRLLDEAHMVLRQENSPAREVTAALRLAHGADPRSGLRTVLLPTDRRGGAR